MSGKIPALRILIVEDEPLIRWAMAETLLHLGYAVTEVGSARETIAQLDRGHVPDLVFLDFRLPDSSDLQLLETIRRRAPESGIVMMTAFATPEMAREAYTVGATRVLDKPLEMADLPSLVEQCQPVRRRRS
ncbi:MAG: response regulator [Vicinamibacterales bacterium]